MVLFPEPETPVMTDSRPTGNRISRFLRLFACAPRISSHWASCKGRQKPRTGRAIGCARYLPVAESSHFRSSFMGPRKSRLPPLRPAPGPRSTIRSARRIVSSSCSTTTTVLPFSFSAFKLSSSRSLSRGCNPMVGSSRTYKTPRKLDRVEQQAGSAEIHLRSRSSRTARASDIPGRPVA